MRKIIVLAFVTLDGVMQSPGGPEEDTSGGFRYGGWVVPHLDDALLNVMGEQMKGPFALLLGRKTFEIFASYWPEHEGDWPGVNDANKYVVSNTLSTHTWKNSVFLTGENIVEKIKNLKAEDGPNIQVYGSSILLQTLLKHDLIDELWLKIFPVVIGSGKRLFAEGTIPAAFTLTDSKVLSSGVVVVNYKRAGEIKTGHFGF